MKRRDFLPAIAVAALPARSLRAQRLPRIGFLNVIAPNPDHPLVRASEEGLREHGLIDGQTAIFEKRWASGRVDALPALAAELAALPVDVIVTGNNFVTAAAKAATSTIPIVMVVAVDPVRNGFIDSFARPGRNITGLTVEPGQQIHGKMLEMLNEAAPQAERVGVLVTEGLGYDRAQLAEVAQRLRLRMLPVPEVRQASDIELAFEAMRRDDARGYYCIGGTIVYTARAQVAALALRHRLPGMHFSADYVRAGGLLSHGIDQIAQYRRAGWYVARILAGARPAELPVEQPARFEIAINLRTARSLGLKLPQSLLLRADEVIE
jgi:putative tryptophan/tyrosine transport system substrate-binding protein